MMCGTRSIGNLSPLFSPTNKHAYLVRSLQSKILVTTRIQKVAEIEFSQELVLLNVDDGWELLKKKAFLHNNNIPVDLQKFKMLKSLAIFGFKFAGRKLPRGITNLVHLKYLNICGCELNELPSSIRDLAYLETLSLLGSLNIRIPNVLGKMSRLKHLILPSYDKKRFGNYRVRLNVGDELETLFSLDSSKHELTSTARMKNLRRFTPFIRDSESLSTIINAIATKWTKLEYCMVVIEKGCEFTSKEGLRKLKLVFTCPNLYYLDIHVKLGKQLVECRRDIICSKLVSLIMEEDCEIEDDSMVILGELPALKCLRLNSRSFIGKELTCRALSFPRLGKLVLSGLLNLRKWRVEEGAMPLLLKLKINNCPHLFKLPNGLSRISTLEQLKILGMPELGKRVLESGKDFHKVRHVPTINVEY